MKGGWFTLEQAGRLLRDAKTLLELGSFSTAAGLALLSREELAKSRKLFQLWMKADRGEPVTRKQIAEALRMDHVEKQRHGASGFVMSIPEQHREALFSPDPDDPDYQAATQSMNLAFERLRKRAPRDRTEQRERAFYVDPNARYDGWLRPGDLAEMQARAILRDANNDFWQYRNPGMPGRTHEIKALREALAMWADKPSLVEVEFE
jgi:AbiV family abortive infection protein